MDVPFLDFFQLSLKNFPRISGKPEPFSLEHASFAIGKYCRFFSEEPEAISISILNFFMLSSVLTKKSLEKKTRVWFSHNKTHFFQWDRAMPLNEVIIFHIIQ